MVKCCQFILKYIYIYIYACLGRTILLKDEDEKKLKKKKKALTQSELNEKFMMKPRHSHKIHIEKEINKFKVELMLKLRKKINVKKIKNKD